MKFFLRILDNGRVLIKDLQTHKTLIVRNMDKATEAIKEKLDEQEEKAIGDNPSNSGDLSES